MDHEAAIQNQAVERYFLGEMKPDEREAFEEHYFVCESCAGDVQATSRFLDNARAVLKEPRRWAAPAPAKRSWFRPSFAFASLAALCLIVVGYQNIQVIPALKAPQALTPAVILDGATRSAVPTIKQGDALHFEMPWDRGGPAFVELLSGSSRLAAGTLPAPAANQPLEVYFPGRLKPGRYRVVAHPLNQAQSVTNEFDVIP